MSTVPLVAVTGGAGLLGRAVISRLLADGWRVRQLVRKPSSGRSPKVEAVIGGLEDGGALRRLVAGADAVVHAACLTRAWRASDYYEANVEGNHRLGKAIRAAASEARLVVASSLAARFPWLSAYAASRADGEDAVVEAAGVPSWAVLRLGPLYGPGDRKTLALMEAATWPLMPIPDRPDARISLLHVDDAAAAVAGACGTSLRGAIWEVGDTARPWSDIARAVMRAVAGTPRLVRVSPRLLAIGVTLTHPLGSRTSPLLSPIRLAELLHDDWVARPICQPPATVWRVRTALDDGLSQSVGWFRSNGWLAPPVTLTATQLRG
ncbi:MAG: NAD(P)-dependent oxidoreductase [Magnetospirillum sp.]|nr:NAD(P)-dependent oxidoreductase [Magnetospirillum sp.]